MEPELQLALGITTSPRAYAFLLGSGVSRAAGIPTGWEVVSDLARKVAQLKGDAPEDPVAWFESTYSREPGYSDLLEELGATQTERMKLLQGYFERESPDADPVAPTKAHHEIARLVALGLVGVVITTNFDHLLEMALREAGVEPTVVSSGDDVAGAPPTAQNRCTVIKPHGDYLDARIRNTPQELATLDPEIAALVTTVLREHGVVTIGWSGEWDTALRTLVSTTPCPYYGTYIVTRGEPTGALQTVAAGRGAQFIRARDADGFAAGLADRVVSLRDLARRGTLTPALAAATAKRYLPRPEETIRLHDLVIDEATKIRERINGLGTATPTPSTETVKARLDDLASASEALLAVSATLGYFGDAENGRLLALALDRLGSWQQAEGMVRWIELRRYPAMLALYAAGTAACARGNFEFLAQVLRSPVDSDRERGTAADVLIVPAVLDHNAILGVRNIGREPTQAFYTPASDHVADVVRGVLRVVSVEDPAFTRAFDRFEYFMAMAYVVVTGRNFAPVGQFAWRYRHRDGGLPAEIKQEIVDQTARWPPIAAGLFTVEEVTRALGVIEKRLEEYERF